MTKEQIAEKILETLTKQRFYDWYSEGGAFDKYISGDTDMPTKEKIIEDIIKLFHLE